MFHSLRFSRVCSDVCNFKNRAACLIVQLLILVCFLYHKICKAFSKFYHRHSKLIVNVRYIVFHNFSATQHIKASILYYFSLYKFGRIFGKSSFPDQLKKDS